MALANIYRVVQDLEGNVVTGVLCTVTLSGTSTLASLFADDAGTLPLPNPTTNNAQYGSFSLFVGASTYDMQFVKAGFTFETQRNITLRDPAAGVNTITGTANRVLVSPVPGVGAVTLSTPQDIAPDSNVQFNHLGLGTPAPVDPIRLTIVGGLLVDSPTLYVDSVNHRVGIGITNPPVPLYVQGAAELNGPVTVGARLAVNTLDDLNYQLKIAAGPALAVDNFGRIGIGTAPQAGSQLYVLGDTTCNGQVGIGTRLSVGTAVDSSFMCKVGALPYLGVFSGGQMLINTATGATARLTLRYDRGAEHGLGFLTVNDSGATAALAFFNAAGSQVGSVTTTGAATAYNTTSDQRLKHDVATLTGELALIQALRPVAFRWNADNSPGVGFLAQDVAALVAGVITGEPDGVDAEGHIVPQQIDHAKLVPWLVGAIQTLAQRLDVVEDAVGA